MTTRLKHVLLCAAMAPCAAAVAQDRGGATDSRMTEQQLAPMLTVRETRFRFLDRNGDGFVAQDEVAAEDNILRSQFTSLDANNDGRLSKTEFVLSHRKAIE